MAKSSGQKSKILYILKYLEEESSINNPITTKQIIDYLEKNSITAERKSIYDDIESLKSFGIKINKNSNRSGGGYYISEREFELPELKLLVDAVQACRFIPQDMTRKLIKKLERKASAADKKQLQRDVEVGEIRTINGNIFSNIDGIYQGIHENCQISFDYMDWNIQKKLESRDGKIRVVSPWKLIWNNEFYYLAAYDKKDKKIKHYRVDKMDNVKVLEDKRENLKEYNNMNVVQYTNGIFGMFGGEVVNVTLNFPKHMIGVVIDRFGHEVSVRPLPDDTINVHVRVNVSEQFFGWLAGLREARIVSPSEVKEKYLDHLHKILENQQK